MSTSTDIPVLSAKGLMDNIERGVRKDATPAQRDRAHLALDELRRRVRDLQDTSRRYHEEHRNDRYDGLS